MPEAAVRFGVRAPGGQSSDVWKCWINNGSGKRDVYLTSRVLGKALKLTLHDVRWHVGFHFSKRDELFPAGEVPETRFLGTWERAHLQEGAVVLGARVLFPWNGGRAVPREAPPDTLWIPAAPSQKAVEVLCFLVADDSGFGEPHAQNLRPLGDLHFGEGGGVRLFSREVQMLLFPALGGTPKFFAGKSAVDLPDANAMVAWGEQPDGSIWFLESGVHVEGPVAT